MAHPELVSSDIEAGRQFLRQLDAAGVPTMGAYWLWYSEEERWRLVIVSPDATRGVRDLYGKAISIDPELDLTKVRFVPPADSAFRALENVIDLRGEGEVRLSNNMLGGVYIEDALIYRLAA